jgi:hypothetical protein
MNDLRMDTKAFNAYIEALYKTGLVTRGDKTINTTLKGALILYDIYEALNKLGTTSDIDTIKDTVRQIIEKEYQGEIKTINGDVFNIALSEEKYDLSILRKLNRDINNITQKDLDNIKILDLREGISQLKAKVGETIATYHDLDSQEIVLMIDGPGNIMLSDAITRYLRIPDWPIVATEDDAGVYMEINHIFVQQRFNKRDYLELKKLSDATVIVVYLSNKDDPSKLPKHIVKYGDIIIHHKEYHSLELSEIGALLKQGNALRGDL